MITLIGAAVAPGLALLCYFYLRDNLEPEPISMVVRSFIFGILIAFPVMILQYIIQVEWGFNSVWASSVLSAAIVEEFFKWLVVFLTAYKHVEFNEPYDGIVYAVATSLGFATLENLLYLILNGNTVAIWRSLLPVSSHALFAVWMGYYMGRAKFAGENENRRVFLLFSLFLPMLLHVIYNVIFMSAQYWMMLIIPFMIVLWWLGLKKVHLAHEFGSKNAHNRPQ
ncbi:glutamic-type intramembrane protease PrsW [Brevibacillus daliensis]|uniref:glutamic-type intramembrane protease PrsW n=1 Tax=Brevibacillus daliensis TaxID=2892995 RepID=UPI001E44DA43|nr:glutamic-type intramembrane protease PrsW [Brevibacillus daliensis]